ncbi:methionine--tRNA ligase [Erythrobacteraceae bacterium CFH 75059]|uniref:methionine--tRNA ligase n=1 Tax=Qipengyuania thermophila TaxID=2509361 RepID=UPI00101F5AD9|nr:methionine--tRNA ligase [Qipengyuania thermophila]TCD05203.1 methionine--tRNA ligase [Erythrobacteraceae bacterium CFH 75059]
MTTPFYITTAINYPNGRPHIGHAYEAICADVIARFQRAQGRRVRFQTGTDEHGLKMMRKAREQGVTPAALADEMSSHFRHMADALHISYDRFIRTVEPAHHAASAALWEAMKASGDLYLGRYEGWYSVRDEAFYDETELRESPDGGRLSPLGTPVEWTVEESWFFRLSRFAEPLLKLYEERPDFIEPAARRNEMVAFVRQGLRDLSVSRTSFDWGVKVPGAPDHVMYVWVDALTNYITGLGYPEPTEEMRDFWPADLHLIGKDIVRFHAVYWPAFLMSAKLPLPRKVFGHGFVLNQGEKESKSLGNVTDPLDLAERYGVDALRYFLMREIPFGQDGSWSHQAIVTRANAELSNSYGNLVQRVLGFIARNLDGTVARVTELQEADAALLNRVRSACLAELPEQWNRLALNAGLDAWMKAVYAANAYVDEQAPWALRKTDPERMATVLAVLCNVIEMLTSAIQPVIPASARKVLHMLEPDHGDLGTKSAKRGAALRYTVRDVQPLFPRLADPTAEPEGC